MEMDEQLTGNIFNIKKFAVHDGPGIRTTVFFKGCPLNCVWCHNPESQGDHQAGLQNNLKSIRQIVEAVEMDRIFFDESAGGVTISGGEPLVQWEFLLELLKNFRKLDIHSALDTTGFSETRIFNEVSEYVDMFLYDLKLIDEKEHLQYTGVSNKMILNNLDHLSTIGKKVWMRFPLIPGITDSDENIRGIGSFLRNKKNIERISVLPYHSLGSHKYGHHKYDKLSTEWRMENRKTPDKETIDNVCSIFKEYGLNSVTGG